MSIPFIDFKSRFDFNKTPITNAIQVLLEHGQYIMGPKVLELEQAQTDYIDVKHALAFSSGTHALVMPLLTKNLSESDAIFTSPFTLFLYQQKQYRLQEELLSS